jgi:hypothetical protein
MRRYALVLLGICCLALCTGCPWDDDDDAIPTVWTVDWTGDSSGINPLDIPAPIDDLTKVTSFMETYGDYTVQLDVNGGSITLQIWDWTNNTQFNFFATGTINSATSANGSYTGTDESGGAISGSWSIVKK